MTYMITGDDICKIIGDISNNYARRMLIKLRWKPKFNWSIQMGEWETLKLTSLEIKAGNFPLCLCYVNLLKVHIVIQTNLFGIIWNDFIYDLIGLVMARAQTSYEFKVIWIICK